MKTVKFEIEAKKVYEDIIEENLQKLPVKSYNKRYK